MPTVRRSRDLNLDTSEFGTINELTQQHEHCRVQRNPDSSRLAAPNYCVLNFSVINAGVKSNIVPATCTLLINRRYIPSETFEDVVGEIQEAVDRGLEKSVALDARVDVFHVYPAMRKRTDGPKTLKMKEAAMLVHGYTEEDFVLTGGSGSTDMANVQQEMGWDDIPFRGPGRMDSRAHGANEFVRMEDVKSYLKELIHYLAF